MGFTYIGIDKLLKGIFPEAEIFVSTPYSHIGFSRIEVLLGEKSFLFDFDIDDTDSTKRRTMFDKIVKTVRESKDFVKSNHIRLLD